jgi:hypothetical protein
VQQYSVAPSPGTASVHKDIDNLAEIASAAAHKMLEYDGSNGALLSTMRDQIESRVGAEQATMRSEMVELKEDLRRLRDRSVTEDRLARSEVQLFEHRHLIESMRSASKEIMSETESTADHVHGVSSMIHEVNARLVRTESMLSEQRRMIEEERNLIDEERHARGLQYEQLMSRMDALIAERDTQTKRIARDAAALSEHMHLVLDDREKRIREGIFGSHELKLVLQQQEERCLQATQLAIDDMFTEIVDGTPDLCKSFCLPFSQSVKLST